MIQISKMLQHHAVAPASLSPRKHLEQGSPVKVLARNTREWLLVLTAKITAGTLAGQKQSRTGFRKEMQKKRSRTKNIGALKHYSGPIDTPLSPRPCGTLKVKSNTLNMTWNSNWSQCSQQSTSWTWALSSIPMRTRATTFRTS